MVTPEVEPQGIADTLVLVSLVILGTRASADIQVTLVFQVILVIVAVAYQVTVVIPGLRVIPDIRE